MTEKDRDSVGLTPESVRIVAKIQELEWFSDGQDIGRFSMAYAIQAGVPEGTTSDTDTRWAAGNFDRTGEMRALLRVVYPMNQAPVKLMEHLVNEGLKLLAARIETDGRDPVDLFV